MKENEEPVADGEEAEEEDFGELLKYTVAGFAGGLIAGSLLDFFGFQKSPVGQ